MMTDFDRGKTFDTNYDAACKLIDKLTAKITTLTHDLEAANETVGDMGARLRELTGENARLDAEIKRLNKMMDLMADALRGESFPCFTSHEIKSYFAEKVT